MTAGALNPIEFGEDWDYIKIGQVKSPGIAYVGEFKRKYEFDKKKGKGTKGSTSTLKQIPPSEGQIKFKLWKPSHFTAWASFQALLEYDPTKKQLQAVDIYHPSLEFIKVKSVLTTDISNPMRDGKGAQIVTVSFLEFFPPDKKSAVATPTGSRATQSGTTPGLPPDPIAEAKQAQIAELLKQATAP